MVESKASTPAVLDIGVELLMLQIAPGFEQPVAVDLMSRGARLVYKAVGKYDLIAVSTFTAEPRGIGSIGPEHLPRVVDYEHLVTFLYRSEHNAALLRLLETDGVPATNWLGVTMLKLNSQWFANGGESPIEMEFHAFREIERRLSEVGFPSYLVAGGMGWFNHIVLTWSDQVEDISAAVLAIDAEGRESFLKSLTVFGLSLDFLTGSRQWSRLDEAENVSAEVLVTCRSGDIFRILEIVRHEAKDPNASVVFGSEEIVARSGLRLGEYFSWVLRLREHYGRDCGIVWATNTRLLFNVKPRVGDAQLPETQSDAFASRRQALAAQGFRSLLPVPFDAQPAEVAYEDTYHLHKRFGQMYVSAVQSPVTWDAYIDMIPALRELVSYYDNKAGFREALFRDVLVYLNQAYQQRSLGTLNSPWSFGNPVPLFYRGGIHRAVWAVEALIDGLFQQAGDDWTGFAVFGVSPDYLRSHLGIVSVPLRMILSPGLWWGVFHEAGHEFYYRRMRAASGPALERLLAEVVGDYSDDQIAGQYIDNQVWEAVSDIFDYEFGFLCDWVLYRDTVIDYLIRFILARRPRDVEPAKYPPEFTFVGEQLLGYLSRLLCVYIRHSKVADDVEVGEVARRFKTEVVTPIKSLFRELLRSDAEADVDRLDHLLSDHRLERRFLDSGLSRLVRSQEGREFLGKVLPQPPDPEAIRDSKEAARQIMLGNIPTGPVQCPQVLICEACRLARGDGRQDEAAKPPSYASRVATILVLWNLYAKRLPAVVDKVLGLPGA